VPFFVEGRDNDREARSGDHDFPLMKFGCRRRGMNGAGW